jgi:hypothetical protein
MIENVTYCQISDSINWFQLIGSFLIAFFIAFFTIHYSQYIRDKREFEATMNWFLIEITHLNELLNRLVKTSVDEQIKKMELQPDKKELIITFFPDCSLNSYNFIMSKGYFSLLLDGNYIEKMTTINLHALQLKYLQSSFSQLTSMGINVSNYNEQKKIVLKAISEEIDIFDKESKSFKAPKYPRKFMPRLSNFIEQTRRIRQ